MANKFTVYRAGETNPRQAFVIKNPRKSKSSGREFGYIDQKNGDRGEIIVSIKGGKEGIRLPFGLKISDFPDGGKSCTLAWCFDGAVPEGEPGGHDEEQEKEHQFMKRFDEMMIDQAMEHPKDFLGKVRQGTSKEKLGRLAAAAYSPLIRPGRTNPTTGKQYAALCQAKVPISDGLPTVPVRLRIPGKKKRKHVAPEDVLDLLGRNTRCRITFKIKFIWFRTTGSTKKFGISREVTSIEILPTKNRNRVIDPNKFDPSKLVIEPDYMNQYGSPTARVSYDGVQLVISAPKGTVMGSHVTGLGIEDFENSGNPFFRIMWNDRNDPDVRALVAVLYDLTKKVTDVAYDRRESWFGDTDIDKDDVHDYLNPIMRQMDDRQDDYTRNDDEPVYIKIKLPFAPGSTDDEPEFRAKFQDRDGVEIKGRKVYDALSRGGDASVMFKARPVYIMQRSMYGIPFEAVTVTIDISLAEIEANAGKTVNAEDRLFEDDDDEDEDCEETVPVAVAAATATNSTTTTTTTTDEVSTETTVDDDDDDEDYVDEEDGDEYTDDSDEDAAGDEIVAHA